MKPMLRRKLDRRCFPADCGMAFTGMALGALSLDDSVARADAPPPAHFRTRAKSVIQVFLYHGFSHLETFDPKPALNRCAGLTFDKAPFPDPLKSPLHDRRSRSVVADEVNVRDRYAQVYPHQVGYAKHGQSGIDVSDWLPEIARGVDRLCIVRSLYTTDNDYAAENQ